MCCILFVFCNPYFCLFVLRTWCALIQAVLALPFCLAIICIGNVAHSLILFPVNVFRGYWTLLTTPLLGPNLKTLGFILSPVGLVLIVGSALILWAVVAITLAFICPFMMVFDIDNARRELPYCGGLGGFSVALMGSFVFVKDTFDFARKSLPGLLADYRRAPPPGRAPFDISLCQIFVCILVAVCGLVLDTVGYFILGLVKLPFGIIFYWALLWR